MRIDYARLGPDGFRNLCHAVLRETLGPNYQPFTSGGPDGGRDGIFEGTPRRIDGPSGYWVCQFKCFDTVTVGSTAARTRLLSELRKELERWTRSGATGIRVPDVLLFITNVRSTAVPGSGLHDRFSAAVAELAGPIRQVLLWDQARLDLEVVRLPGAVAQAFGTGTAELPGKPAFSAVPYFSRDYDAVIVIGELGNGTGRPLTVRQATLSIPDARSLIPDAPPPGFSTGARWAGTDPITIGADLLVRWAWFFPASGTGLRDRLATAEPVRVLLQVACFPRRRLQRTLDVYTIGRLREVYGEEP